MTMRPTFPPLLRGEAVAARLDPFEKAQAAVLTDGADPGRVYYSESDQTFRAAIVLAPEMPLAQAVGVIFAVELGVSDALGALAPPEVAVHFVWPDRIKVNGALCGTFRASASTHDPSREPDWLIVGVEIPVQRRDTTEPGDRPDETVLAEEGCADVTVPDLIESWSRHTLLWINTFVADGLRPLHEAWRGKCDSIGEAIAEPRAGTFVGLDADGGLLLRTGTATEIIPLTTILDRP